MAVLGDANAEERFYLSATALTSVEHFMDEEDVAWRRILHESKQNLRELAQSQRVTADSLVRDEAEGRIAVAQQERRAFHEQCLVVELLRNGCAEAQCVYDAGVCALPLIHLPSPTKPDESWRDLPTMVEVDMSELKPNKYTLSAARQQLLAADVSYTDDVVLAMCRKEATARAAIVQRYHETVCRVERQYKRWFDGLRAIEETIEADYRQLVIARLPLDERWAYIVGPTEHSESAQRRLLCLAEDATFTGALLGLGSLQKLSIIHRECVRIGAELCQRRTEEQQSAMHARRLAVHGLQRFQTWLSWRRRCQNLRRQRDAAPQRCVVASVHLLRAYCVKWRDVLIVPKRLQQQRSLLEEAFTESHAMVVREEEERERNAFSTEELLCRHNVEEQFLSGRDQARSAQRAAELLDLEARSIAAHRLLALMRWYAIVRSQQLHAKSEWLRSATERKLTQQYLSKWVLSPPTIRSTRTWRRQAGRAMWVHQLQQLLLSVEEPEQRAVIALAQTSEQELFARTHHQTLLEACRDVQHQRVERLETRNLSELRQARWNTWLLHTLTVRRSARAFQLERRNQHAHLRCRFACISRSVAPRCAAIAELRYKAEVAQQHLALDACESLQRCFIVALSERSMVQMFAVAARQRHRRSDAPALGNLEGALANQRVTSHRAVVARFVLKWQSFVARAARLRGAIQHKLPAMERAWIAGTIARYHSQWLAFVARARVHRLMSVLPSRETECRLELEGAASEAFASLTTQNDASQHHASAAAMARRVESLAATNAMALLGRYWVPWRSKGARRLRRLQCVPLVEALAARNVRLRWFATWRRASTASLALQSLGGIRVEAERRLLRKYYLRLAPRLLRLAKVSRAKANMERAQEAAKVLAIADVSHRALHPAARLPPIRRSDGNADSKGLSV